RDHFTRRTSLVLRTGKIDLGTSAQQSTAKGVTDESICLALLNGIVVTAVRSLISGLPVSIVENQGFRELLQLLEPRYTPDRQHYIQRAWFLLGLISLPMTQFFLVLSLCRYLGVTCHFLSADWQMHSALLACLPLTNGSSGSRMLSDFEEVCRSHGVSGRAFCVVADPFLGTTTAKPCCLPGFQVSLPNGQNGDYEDKVDNCNSVKEGIRNGHGDGVEGGEWNDSWEQGLGVSRVDCFSRSLEQCVSEGLRSCPQLFSTLAKALALGGSERALLRELTDTLEPFTEAWDMVHGDRMGDLQTDRHVSISLALPCVLGLRKHLSETSTPHCPSLLVSLSQALESWLAPILEDPLYITATTLDPQFKLTWSSNPDWHKDVLVQELSKHSTLFSFIKQRPTTQAKSLEQELAVYLREEPTDEEALHYWQRKSIDFPLLSQVAKKAFTIPACGTVVESIFTTAGCCLRPLSGRILPKNLEMLIYLKANYRLLWT
uniref:HAT C-terminal dimerisation domain-containing protein n=1 Tax=Mola mola TaxID=94237 RepID=A0A3Q3WQE5_MOLML